MSDDITISREYYFALLRRAEYGEQERLENRITIDFDKYSRLQKAYKEYTALKNALIEAGTPLESIQILIDAHIGATTPNIETNDFTPIKVSGSDTSTRRSWSKAPFLPPGLIQGKSWWPEDSVPTTPTTVDTESADSDTSDVEEVILKPSYRGCHESRSVTIRGVPKNTNMEHICKAVRGGAILNLYRQEHDQAIQVTFVEPLEAEGFIRHVKRNDLYIRSKRVEVSWSERQYYVRGGLAYQIKKQGATRNLVIRFPSPGVTADIIRDDLEHIHLLEIVSLRFENGHAWISLNGVQHALTARKCMSSRFRYKGSSIQFWPDECADPWKVVARSAVKAWKPNHQAKVSVVSVNRFDGLSQYNDDKTTSESGSDE